MTDRDRYAADINRASYWWEARKDGLVVASEWNSDNTENPLTTLPSTPYEFHAMAYRPTSFANYFWLIEDGMEPIWLHVVLRSIGFNGCSEQMEALVFGRRHPDKREEVLVVLWDGTAHGFDSVEKAMGAFTV